MHLGIKARARLPLLFHQLAKAGQNEFAVLFDRFVRQSGFACHFGKFNLLDVWSSLWIAPSSKSRSENGMPCGTRLSEVWCTSPYRRLESKFLPYAP